MAFTLEDLSYRVLPRVKVGRALSDSEWTTLMTLAEIMGDGAPMRVPPSRVADNVERFMIHGRSARAFRVRVLLTLVEYMTVPGFGARFSRLDRDTRRKVVEARFVQGDHLWGVCAKARMLVLMGMYGDRKAMDAIGFVPVALRTRPVVRASGSTQLRAVPSLPEE